MHGRFCRILAVSFFILAASDGAARAGIDETYNRPGPSVWLTDYYARWVGPAAFRKSIAVVVGVGDYDRFPRLSAPAADARRMRDFLRDEAGFDQIITLTDEKATQARIEELMEQVIPDALGQNDRFLFYFSGHGVTRNLATTKRGYLVLKKSAQGSWQDMLDMERVKRWTENVAQARHALFLLDACFSGLAALESKAGNVREKTIARLMQPGHYIVTAGTEGEETYIYKGESLFTQAFLSAARGEGMAPNDGVVSLNEMMSRINRMIDAKQAEIGDKIRMTPRQYYARITNNGGEFFFLPQGRAAATNAAVSSSISTPVVPKSAAKQTVPSPNAPAEDLPAALELPVPKGPKSNSPPSRNEVPGDATLTMTPIVPGRRASPTAALSDLSPAPTVRPEPIASPKGSRRPTPGAAAPAKPISMFDIRDQTEAKGAQSDPASFVGAIGECEKRCLKSVKCRAFSYGKAEGACYLYSQASLSPNPLFESGVALFPSSAPAPGADAAGSSKPIRTFDVRDQTEAKGTQSDPASFVGAIGECEQKCLKSGKCRVFAYSKAAGTCYLYSQADLSPNPLFQSGVSLSDAGVRR